MKISMWIPKEEDENNICNFLKKEIAEAKNIKSKETRKDTLTGLMSIWCNFSIYGSGYCYFADGNDIETQAYFNNIKKYNCGKEFVKPETSGKFR